MAGLVERLEQQFGRKRVVKLFDKIDEDTALGVDGMLAIAADAAGKGKPIVLMCDSAGGNVEAMKLICRRIDRIRAAGTPVVGVVAERCASAAVNVFAACSLRLMKADSSLNTHEVGEAYDGGYLAGSRAAAYASMVFPDIGAATALEYRKLNEGFIQHLERYAGQTLPRAIFGPESVQHLFAMAKTLGLADAEFALDVAAVHVIANHYKA